MIKKLGKRVICFLFVLGIDSFLENVNRSCLCSLCPILSANLRIRPLAASCPLRSEAPAGGEKVFHREFARVSTGVSVWVWAELVFADLVTFGSPVVVIFFLAEESPFSWFGQKISHY